MNGLMPAMLATALPTSRAKLARNFPDVCMQVCWQAVPLRICCAEIGCLFGTGILFITNSDLSEAYS